MALGHWLTEKLIYDKTTGELKTNRTWNYKPPGAKDIPVDFRVEFTINKKNPKGVLRSKGKNYIILTPFRPNFCITKKKN